MEDLFHLTLKAIIRNQDNKILILKVDPSINTANVSGGIKSHWDLPGGRIQRGETIKEGLQREIFEETGIEALETIEHLVTAHTSARLQLFDKNIGLMIATYHCTLNSIPDELLISEEHCGYDWATQHEVAERLDQFPQLVRDAIRNL